MKKTLCLVLAYLFLLTTLPLVGVGVSAEVAVSQQASSAAVLEQVPSNLQDTQVRMQIWWTPGDRDEAKAAAFEDATGISVVYDSVPMDEYMSQQALGIAAHKPVSLAAIINEWYPTPIVNGLFQPLSNVSGWDFSDDSVYATSLMDQFAYKGERYGIAIKGSTDATFQVMFYNKDILAQCGIKMTPYDLWKAGSWNWDTFLALARSCTDSTKRQYGVSMVAMYPWMLSAGEDFVKSDATGLVNNVRSSALMDAWLWNWDLINTYKVVDTSYTGQIPFLQGKVAMLGAGSYMMQADTSFANYIPQNMYDNWGVVPFPSPKGQDPVTVCDGTVWGFPTGVRGNTLQAAAWYLRYYLDDANNPLMEDVYPTDHPECWEIMNWMWEQPIQSYNSVGTITFGGDHTAYTIQYTLLDEADTKAHVKTNLDMWDGIFNAKISQIEALEGHTCYYGYECDATCEVCGLANRKVYHTYDGPNDANCNVCYTLRNMVVTDTNVVPNSGFENGLEGWQEWGLNGTYEEGAHYSAKVLEVWDSDDGKVLEFKKHQGASDWFGIHLDGITVKPNTQYQLKVRYKIAPDAVFEYYDDYMTGYLFIRGMDEYGIGTGLGDIYDEVLASAYMNQGSKLEWREDTITFRTYDSDKIGLDLRAIDGMHYYIDSIQLLEHTIQVDAGDVDGTGYATLKDLALLQRYINGWDVDVLLEPSDVNGDGKINVRDLGLLQQYLNGWNVELHQY